MWNPMIQLIGMLRNGGAPRQMARQMAMSNPQVRQVVSMLDGKSSQELQAMAMNMCRERGVSPEDIMRQLGM